MHFTISKNCRSNAIELLNRHFKNNGHSPSKIVIQPVEKIIYDPNSSTRLKNIKGHEIELNGLNFCNHLFF